MLIKFSLWNLDFEADVDYSLEIRPPYYDPGEPGEIEINSLTCDGLDAHFLVNSDLAYDVEDTLWDAIAEVRQREEEDHGAEQAAERFLRRLEP